MPDLNLGPAPTRSPIPAILGAVVVLALVAAAVFYFNPHKTADVHVTNIQLFAPHTVFSAKHGNGTNIIGSAEDAQDDLYVVATVRIDNRLRLPLFLTTWNATMTTKDGSELAATTVYPADFPRLSQSFPPLATMLQQPLSGDSTAPPGATLQGVVLLLFPNTTQAAWNSKKSASLTLKLAHQDPQTVALP